MIGQSIQPTDKGIVNILASSFFFSKGATARGESPVQNRLTKDLFALESSTKIVSVQQYLSSAANPLDSDFLTPLVLLQWVFSLKVKKSTTERRLSVGTLSASQARFTIIESRTSDSQASVLSKNGAVVVSNGSATMKTSLGVSVGLCASGVIFFFFALTLS